MNDTNLPVDTLVRFTGGIAAVFAGQPMDTVKVKMQLYPKTYTNMLSSITHIARHQGIRGFYPGTLPALVSNCADNAIMFVSYGQCQGLIAKLCGVEDRRQLNCFQNALSGSVVSLFTSTVLAPTELIKIRMQNMNSNYINGERNRPKISETIRNIWKVNGWKGMFRGLGCTIVRESVGCSIFFGLYEWFREYFKPAGKSKENCSPLATMASVVIAEAAMWFIVFPIDVIKSRVQISQKPIGFQLVKYVIRGMDMRGLYRGFLPTLIKTVPITGLVLLSLEFVRPLCRKLIINMTEIDPSYVNDITDKITPSCYSMCDLMSGWAAGIVSTTVGHPIDTIRVIQQVTNTSTMEAMQKLYTKDKFAGYFRGLMFPILSTGIVNSVFFGVNGTTMRYIQKYRNDGTDDYKDNRDIRFCCNATKLNKYWHLDVFTSGCVAGIIYAFINTPTEVVKTTMQALNVSTSDTNTSLEDSKKTITTKTTSPIKLVSVLYRANGIRSLYRGGWMIMLRDVPRMGLYMLSYEHSCSVLKKLFYADTKQETMPMFICVTSGGFAGVTSWILLSPIDMIKSRIIADNITKPIYKGAWDCARKTFAEGGLRCFFRGIGLLCVRSFPANGIMFLVYEQLLSVCNNYKEQNSIQGTNVTVKSRWS